MANGCLRVCGGLGGRIAMKPDWKDAPEWAKWLAQDDDGWFLWFGDAPYKRGDIWIGPYMSKLCGFEFARTKCNSVPEPRP